MTPEQKLDATEKEISQKADLADKACDAFDNAFDKLGTNNPLLPALEALYSVVNAYADLNSVKAHAIIQRINADQRQNIESQRQLLKTQKQLNEHAHQTLTNFNEAVIQIASLIEMQTALKNQLNALTLAFNDLSKRSDDDRNSGDSWKNAE